MARFRSISIAKRRGNRSETPDTIYTMSSTSTAASSHRRLSSRDYDTGFPDLPRTTTWRHPDANTSPNACISAEDIDPAKALHRHHRHFLSHKYKRTTSHGFITTEMEQDYLKSQEAFDAADSAIDLDDGRALVVGDGDARQSKDSTDSIDRADGSLKGGHSPTSPTDSQFEQKGDSPRKKSLFQRMRHHKH
ncbi:hypothetical protein SCAR479_00724 [Seiridium cardinale]|uniref:Uncharacterized protein n=1 Tax=Seiridium cardinale TaxID=138064 RepID=A0ABR2Y771_9PEZI